MVSSILLDLVLIHQLPYLSVLIVCGRCHRIQSQTYCFCFQTWWESSWLIRGREGGREREVDCSSWAWILFLASYCSVAVPVMIFSRNCCSLPTAAKASPQICSGQLIAVLCFWSSKLMPLALAVHSTQNLIFFWYCGGVLLCVSLTEVLPPCILLVILPNMWNVPRSISFNSSSRSGNTGLNMLLLWGRVALLVD